MRFHWASAFKDIFRLQLIFFAPDLLIILFEEIILLKTKRKKNLNKTNQRFSSNLLSQRLQLILNFWLWARNKRRGENKNQKEVMEPGTICWDRAQLLPRWECTDIGSDGAQGGRASGQNIWL